MTFCLGPENCVTENIKVTAVPCFLDEDRDVEGQQPSGVKPHLCQVPWT